MFVWSAHRRQLRSALGDLRSRSCLRWRAGHYALVSRPSRDVGVAFSMPCDLGFIVGLCTHRHARLGALVWIAEDVWDEYPRCDEVGAIDRWRWPVFFPLGAALRRKIADQICRVGIPAGLADFPVMRNGGNGQPWMEFRDGALGPTTADRDLPIAMIVNDTALKEMIVTGWMPADRW